MNWYIHVSLIYFYQGFAIVNNIYAHRYWTDAGPQKTLFIPKNELSELNSIVLFETERAPKTQEEAFIELVENPIFVWKYVKDNKKVVTTFRGISCKFE